MTLGHVVDRKMREMGYIRKPIVDKLKNRRSWRDRVAAEGAPEVRLTDERCMMEFGLEEVRNEANEMCNACGSNSACFGSPINIWPLSPPRKLLPILTIAKRERS